MYRNGKWDGGRSRSAVTMVLRCMGVGVQEVFDSHGVYMASLFLHSIEVWCRVGKGREVERTYERAERSLSGASV